MSQFLTKDFIFTSFSERTLILEGSIRDLLKVQEIESTAKAQMMQLLKDSYNEVKIYRKILKK